MNIILSERSVVEKVRPLGISPIRPAESVLSEAGRMILAKDVIAGLPLDHPSRTDSGRTGTGPSRPSVLSLPLERGRGRTGGRPGPSVFPEPGTTPRVPSGLVVATAMANPKQTRSKPVASCFAAYRLAVRTAERYGRMGYPMGYRMGYPMPYPCARVMTRHASDQGEPVESTFRASRRDSRVSHAPKLGLHNGYRVSADRGPTTRPAPTGPGLGLVPLRDQLADHPEEN